MREPRRIFKGRQFGPRFGGSGLGVACAVVAALVLGFGLPSNLFGSAPADRPVTAEDRSGVWVDRQADPGRLTRDEAASLLARSLRDHYEPGVRRLFEKGGPFYGRFEQTFYDALVSATYNLGPGVVIPGTPGFETIGRAIEAGDRRAVADALLLYDRAGGVPLAGLTRRRRAERRLILTGNYSTEFA